VNSEASECGAEPGTCKHQEGYRRHTCGGCENLKANTMFGCAVMYCEPTDHVVPHSAEQQPDGSTNVILWRVPESCPLSDDEVIKSADQAAEKHWVKMRVVK